MLNSASSTRVILEKLAHKKRTERCNFVTKKKEM